MYVDSLNSQFISKLSASLYYLPPVNFRSEMFFFLTKAFLLALCIIYSNKIDDAEYLVFGDRRKVTLLSAGVAILARLTKADHTCSNKHSMERVGKVKNADKKKKCKTTCAGYLSPILKQKDS